MSKILIEGNKVIIDGHANDLETCNTLTNLCDELSTSDKFRTVRYESGYGEFESISENKEKKFIDIPDIPPPPPEYHGYQVNIQSNDGSTILAQYDDIDYVVVTSVGAQFRGINTFDAAYTYSGSKLFIGLATSANALVAKYKPGDTIYFTAETTLYIVENIIISDSYSTLTALFSDIATVIREKTGDASAIIANDFPAMIRESLHGSGDSLATPIIDRTISEITNSSIETIGNCAFAYCSRLTSVSFPACTSIGSYAFRSCFNLISLTLGAPSVCSLPYSNAFVSTPIGGYSASAGQYGSIFVPASLLASYKSAKNWSYFSSRFGGY